MNGADIAIVTVVPVELQGCLRVFGLSGPGERIEGINYSAGRSSSIAVYRSEGPS